MNTLVVNCFAGPGAGKTTCAWEVAAELKKKGINCEYISEYAKELVWEEKFDTLKNQEHVFDEQSKRLERLRGKVEVIVTDSPILMSHIYGEHNSEYFTNRIDDEYNKYYNFNLFIRRGESFQQAGRIQNLEESKILDKKILDMLKEKHIYFGVYKHENIKYLADNIITNLQKIKDKPPLEDNKSSTIKDAALYDELYGKESVEGYYIIDKIKLNNKLFVMGYNPKAASKYVTWEKTDDGYNLGRYYNNKLAAEINLIERAESSIDFDKESFVIGVETAIDFNRYISEEDYMLYQRLTGAQETEELQINSMSEDFEL